MACTWMWVNRLYVMPMAMDMLVWMSRQADGHIMILYELPEIVEIVNPNILQFVQTSACHL